MSNCYASRAAILPEIDIEPISSDNDSLPERIGERVNIKTCICDRRLSGIDMEEQMKIYGF